MQFDQSSPVQPVSYFSNKSFYPLQILKIMHFLDIKIFNHSFVYNFSPIVAEWIDKKKKDSPPPPPPNGGLLGFSGGGGRINSLFPPIWKKKKKKKKGFPPPPPTVGRHWLSGGGVALITLLPLCIINFWNHWLKLDQMAVLSTQY